MLNNSKDEYDVIVVGGGHAGSEASYATATMGLSTLLVCLNFKMVSNMPCNPHIGGSAKGIVVREIDALGGIMGKIADTKGALLQIKELNTSKGPGVRCLRAQEDKKVYPRHVQEFLLTVRNLDIQEAEVKKLVVEDHRAKGIVLEDGRLIRAKAVILATGTHMEARILRGHVIEDQGPDGEKSSHSLSGSIASLGLHMLRLKTGTPPRLDPDSIDFPILKREDGMEGYYSFSYDNLNVYRKVSDMLPCYLTYTNEHTHEIIRAHLKDSAMYGGVVEGVGPRYCPSIEDKVVRFKDHPRHQLFLEPESVELHSTYVDGLSTSMPVEVQEEIVHSIRGLEHARFLKYAYAIEYDAIEPSQLDHTLAIKGYEGLYVCGQIAGTSGYEEAAAQGLWAALNIACAEKNLPPFAPGRDEAYMAVLADDLVTLGTQEPYRMFTSRAEHRLLLREDNADARLTPLGRGLGLVDDAHWRVFCIKRDNAERLRKRLEETRIPTDRREADRDQALLPPGRSLAEVLRRPDMDLERLAAALADAPGLSPVPGAELADELARCGRAVCEGVQTDIKYAGYLERQRALIERTAKLESTALPSDLDYARVAGLSREVEEKLSRVRPLNLGQAGRISGVTPAAVACLEIHLHKLGLLRPARRPQPRNGVSS